MPNEWFREDVLMTTIRVHRRIESETLHLPELKPLIGQTVEIIVHSVPGESPKEWLPGFWEKLSQGWQGETLVRPDQGVCDSRDALQ